MTDFGAAVVRACNRLGIVVDVAHGTYDLVKRAALVTSRPLILSQTSLSSAPGRHSRQISPDHARAVAQTGGVVGIWPPASIFPTLDDMVDGFARMVEVVGVDHVGLGTDMRRPHRPFRARQLSRLAFVDREASRSRFCAGRCRQDFPGATTPACLRPQVG